MRITERETLRQLARTCEALGLPCAYTTDGERKPYEEIQTLMWRDDVSQWGGWYGALTLDHQPQYGGARVHAYNVERGDDGELVTRTGHCRAPGMFTGNGIASGMDTRQKLRYVYDVLVRMEADAYRARSEWEHDHGGDGSEDEQRALNVARRATS
jgi:hypothetical protein